MTQLTLLTKAYSPSMLKQIDKILRANLEGLDAKVELSVAKNWVRALISGDDAAIASNYIRKEIGLSPVTLENVKRFDTLKGYITDLRESPDALLVDIGVFEPETIYMIVPLSNLQALLVNGRKVALRKIVELFGLSDGLPVNVKITVLDKTEKRMEAELATEQIERFTTWRESLLDRLIILGAPLPDIGKTLKYLGLTRDIINIEPIGMFEHALTCKLGTDAAGLVSPIGKILRDAKFVVFNPRKIREFFAH